MRNLLALLFMICLIPIAQARFAPHNDLWIGTDEKSTTMDEFTFNAILDKLEAIYGPEIAAEGRSLKIIRKWEDGTVNAWAVPVGLELQVHMFGGLARYNGMTPNGFAMVACHELGHHRGGAPMYTDRLGRIQWAASEGNSDYFASSKCMKRYLDWSEEEQEQDQDQGQNFVVSKCNKVYGEGIQAQKCHKIALAGQVLGRALGGMGDPSLPSLNTPSKETVRTTITRGYPSIQCRVDTYFRGALCDTNPKSSTSNYDSTVGYDCGVEGQRPSCWFNSDSIYPDNFLDALWPFNTLDFRI